MEDTNVMTESPEEKAFFDQKGAETVVVEKTEPELPLEQKTETAEPPKIEEPAKPDHVPLATYIEERNEWKRKFTTQEQKLNKLQELVNEQFTQKPEPEVIDPQTDPIKAIQNLAQKIDQLEAEKKTVGEIQAIAQFGQRQAQAYAEKQPDFYDAYNHLRHSRANQLYNSGVDNPQELNRQVLQDEQSIIKLCATWGVDPADFMYRLAQGAGYQPKPTEQAVVTPPAPSAEEKIKIQAQGQQRAAAAASKVSAGSGGPIDLKALMSLDGDEFDKATAGNNWRKIAGG